MTAHHITPHPADRTFAPISLQPSTRLRFLVGYFAVCGAVGLITGVILAVSIFVDAFPTEGRREVLFWTAVVLVISGLGWLAISRLLHRERRRGAWWAIVALLLPTANLLQGAEFSVGSMILVLIGLALVASVWGELHPKE